MLLCNGAIYKISPQRYYNFVYLQKSINHKEEVNVNLEIFLFSEVLRHSNSVFSLSCQGWLQRPSQLHFNMGDYLPDHGLKGPQHGPNLRNSHINLPLKKRPQKFQSLECSFVKFKYSACVICGMKLLAPNINTSSMK